MEHRNSKQIISHARQHMYMRCYVALLLIAVFLIGVHWSVKQMYSERYDYASTINVAGRQRMLTQKSVMLASRMLLVKDQKRELSSVRSDLLSTLRLTDVAHGALVMGNRNMGVVKPLSHEVKAIYFAEPIDLNQRVTAYIDLLKKMVKVPMSELRADHPIYKEIVKTADPLLEFLDQVVRQYELEARGGLEGLRRYNNVMLACGIFILLFVGLFLLRPMINKALSAQRKMLMANDYKSEFLASMSHEIRTPMNGIIGTTEMMIGDELNYKQQQRAKTILFSAESLLEIINDILDYSKIDSGMMELESHSFNLEMLTRDVAQLLSVRAREKRIELIMCYMPGTPEYIIADPSRIRQIIFNLVGNAIKFTETGHVIITVCLDEDKMPEYDGQKWLKIDVEDTGVGIAADKQRTIFDKFKQGDGSSTRKFGGAGLGLAICSRLTEMMKGEISVKSTEGTGSTFTLSIPVDSDDLAEQDENLPEVLKGVRALIVDDLEINRDIIAGQLSEIGMVCTSVASGKEALAALYQAHESGKPFQMGVFDFMMPEMNGDELAEQVKSQEVFANMPLVVLTSVGEQGYVHTFSKAGFSAILSKPVRRDVLYDALAAVWGAHLKGKTKGLVSIEGNLIAHSVEKSLFVQPEDAGPIFQGYTILLVEDNRINSALAEEILKGMGAVVHCAENGKIAVDILEEDETIDLVLMDCQMPEMDGFEATQLIRKLKLWKKKKLPIIALTANAMEGDKEKCLDAGMDDYLSKPVRKKELLNMLKKWLFDEKMMLTNEDKNPLINEAKALGYEGADLSMLDMEACQQAISALKAKFPSMVGFFVEDNQLYIQTIREGVEQGDAKAVAGAAHTIKSSSKTLGAKAVSELAKKIEFHAREVLDGKDVVLTTISPQIDELQTAFEKTKRAYESLLKENNYSLVSARAE